MSAAVGVNLNVPAVLLGATLAPPLLGPMTGARYGPAIADFALVRRA